MDTAYYSHLPPVTLHKQLTHLTVDTEVTATCLQSHITNNRHTWLWTQRLQPPASSHTSQSTDTPDCGHSLLQPPASSHTSQTTDTPDCGRRGYSHLPPVTPHNQLTHLTVDTEVTATCLQSHLTINWHTWLWTQLITATCLQSHFTNNWHTWLWTQRLQPPASSRTSQTTDTPDCGHRGYSHLPPVTPHNQLTHLTVDTAYYSHLPPVTHHKQPTHLTVDAEVTATCLQSHLTINWHTWLWTQRLQPPASSHTSQSTDTPDCGHSLLQPPASSHTSQTTDTPDWTSQRCRQK